MQFTFNLRTPSIVSKYWWNKSNLNQGRLTDALLLRTTIQWFPLLLSLFLLWLAILSSTSEIQIVSRGNHWIMAEGMGASASCPWSKLEFCGDDWWCTYSDLRYVASFECVFKPVLPSCCQWKIPLSGLRWRTWHAQMLYMTRFQFSPKNLQISKWS